MAHHDGERAVRRQAGAVREDWGTGAVGATLVPAVATFLRQLPMLVVGATGADRMAWATVLSGRPGFLETAGEHTLRVHAHPGADDPLHQLLTPERDVGLLAIDPMARRRARINGYVHHSSATAFDVRTTQVFANCPKYIQRRELIPRPAGAAAVAVSDRLTPALRELITTADTFFVATRAPGHGADVSHRGGSPGFVRVLDSRRLVWPDYVGNEMFMTLGNLAVDNACGLLFLDWEHGGLLHVSGTAQVDWRPAHVREVPGAQRLVRFTIERVIARPAAIPLRWRLVDRFRHNPPGW